MSLIIVSVVVVVVVVDVVAVFTGVLLLWVAVLRATPSLGGFLEAALPLIIVLHSKALKRTLPIHINIHTRYLYVCSLNTILICFQKLIIDYQDSGWKKVFDFLCSLSVWTQHCALWSLLMLKNPSWSS